jgi:hypothetical protein
VDTTTIATRLTRDRTSLNDGAFTAPSVEAHASNRVVDLLDRDQDRLFFECFSGGEL